MIKSEMIVIAASGVSVTSSASAAPRSSAPVKSGTTKSPSPSPTPAANGPGEPTSVPLWVWFAVGLVVISSAVYVFGRSRKPKLDLSVDDTRALTILGAVVSGAAFVAAAARALIVPSGAKTPWVPNLDAITLGWAGAAVLGAVLPVISEITVGSVSLKIQRIGEKLLDETGQVLENWTAALNQYVADAARNPSAPWFSRVNQFVRWRLREAVEWFGTPADEPRLSLWLENGDTHELQFAWSNEISDPETMKSSFALTEGVAGAAFTERITRNEINPGSLPMFKHITGRPPRYKSLLVTPIYYGDRQIGVLSVDRLREEYFDERAITVMRALAFIVGVAIGIAEEMRARAG